jgi:WD40 repeat protein/tRNA A-37 threonylcarbamoyl transferase component Bud32
MKTFDEDREAKLAELLVEYETQLAVGELSTGGPKGRTAVASDEESRRLEQAKACLARLERIWPHPKPFDEETPRAIGRFQILRELGRGGFGIVYLARDEKLGREVALKVQRPEALISPSLRERFVREAKAAARLDHPHIAGVYEVGDAGLRIWIASEYVAGDSLACWLKRQPCPPPPEAAAALVMSLADALACAHRQGVLHRDLKPSNVLVEKAEGRDGAQADLASLTPKLIDFGLAKLDEAQGQETRSGALIGTPQYMAPEQAAGKVREIGPATDVYGLGAILYELLTGRPVFRGDSDVQTLRQVVEDEPVEPRKHRPKLPVDLAAICVKCLEKDPANRYRTADALAVDLRRFLAGEPTLARPLTVAERLVKWSRRRPALAGLVAVSVLAAAVFVIVNVAYILQLRQANQAADQSRNEAETNAATARDQEALANRYLYASRMRLAYELLDQGNAARIGQLLEPYEPPSRLADLRGFEWYHLQRRMHSERLSLSGHRGQVYRAIFSPDGRLLVSGGQDGMIKFWDAATGQELATLAAHRACVNDLSYSLDGQTLISASCDHTIKFWQAQTHELLATLEVHPDEVRCLAISPDGTRLATGGKGKLVVLWDMATREIIKTTDARGCDVNFLAWRDNRTLIIPGDGIYPVLGALFLWNVDTDENRSFDYGARSLAVSPDGLDTVVGMGNGTVRSIPELSTHVAPQRGRGLAARTLAFLPGRNWLAAGYDDATVQVWDWPQASFRWSFVGHTGRVQSVAFAPGGGQLASASFDGTVKLWSFESESTPKVDSSFFNLRSVGPGHVLATSADLKYAALPNQTDEVTIFDLDRGRAVARLPVADFLFALQFSAADSSILYGYAPDAQSIWKWNWREDHVEKVASTPPGRPTDADLSQDGRQLITYSASRATVYDTMTQEVWWTHASLAPSENRSIILSSDRTICAIGTLRDAKGVTELVDLRTKQVLAKPLGRSTAVADGGRVIALADPESAIAVVETRTGRRICDFRPEASLHSLTFSPDARTLATGDLNGNVQLWNVATGQLIARFETNSDPVEALRFSTNGRRLLAMCFGASKDGGDGSNVRLYVWSGTEDP